MDIFSSISVLFSSLISGTFLSFSFSSSYYFTFHAGAARSLELSLIPHPFSLLSSDPCMLSPPCMFPERLAQCVFQEIYWIISKAGSSQSIFFSTQNQLQNWQQWDKPWCSKLYIEPLAFQPGSLLTTCICQYDCWNQRSWKLPAVLFPINSRIIQIYLDTFWEKNF